MLKKLKSNQFGFSLIEVIVYVGLFSLISTTTIAMLFQTVTAFTNLRISRDINDSAVKIMERMTRDIRSANSIDQSNSIFDTNPGKLTIETMSASGTPMTIQYVMVGNALHLYEGASVPSLVDRGSLLSSQTSISGVLFSYIGSGTTEAIKIDLHITASRAKNSATEHFYDTIILRGSY